MRKTILTGIIMFMTASTVYAEWIKYYKSKSDNTVYYYNNGKMKNSGGVITLWTKTADSYPGKIEIVCQSKSVVEKGTAKTSP